jgi:threonine dehydrogenase-like Zn-dependent dehydrogenase
MHGLGVSGLDDSVEEPRPGVGEVLIAPEAAGVCGTDLHVLHEGVFIDMPQGLPVTMGHEVVGRVVGFGPEPAGGWTRPYGGEPLEVGDRVVAEPILNCGSCPQCARGVPNLCANWSHLGIKRDGVWAELVTIPAARVTRVPDHIPVTHAVLAEPLACALHFLDRAQVSPGDSVLVLGGGPAGQLTLLAARAAGAGRVLLSDPVAERRELAKALGADAVLDPAADDITTLTRELSGGAGADVVVEIAGAPPAVTQAFGLPRPGGTLVLAGICGTTPIPVDTNRVVNDEITVRGAFATRWQMGAAIAHLASGLIDVSPVVSLERPWTEATEAMRDLAERPELCKVVLRYQD